MKIIPTILFTIIVWSIATHSQTLPYSYHTPISKQTGITAKTPSSVSKVDTIKWSNDRKLVWDDFQGKPPVNTPYDAASNVEVDWKVERIDGKINFYVFAGFTTRSYSTTRSPSCLAHEQLHFDLCEVYARKIRKYIADFNGKIPETTDGGDMMNHYFQSLREMIKSEGARYDLETDHGRNKAKQKEWETYIGNMLKEFEGYKK